MFARFVLQLMAVVIGTVLLMAAKPVKSDDIANNANITIKLDRYLGGNDTKLAAKPALSFNFSRGASDNVCSIITTDSYLRYSNNRLENINLSEPNFFFDCHWDDTYYFLSKRYRTYAEVIIKQPDSQFPMSMHIEAKLVSLTGERATIISGDIPLKRIIPNE